jgi:hypothetical protein
MAFTAPRIHDELLKLGFAITGVSGEVHGPRSTANG